MAFIKFVLPLYCGCMRLIPGACKSSLIAILVQRFLDDAAGVEIGFVLLSEREKRVMPSGSYGAKIWRASLESIFPVSDQTVKYDMQLQQSTSRGVLMQNTMD